MTDTQTEPGLDERLRAACEIVERAGQEARVAWETGRMTVEEKGHQDFVTEIDRQTEITIRDALLAAFPGDTVLGEEFGGGTAQGMLWVVDPIDGTANYVRGRADWAVSLALVDHGTLALGIVYDGGRDLLYSGRAGHGAFCAGTPVRCSGTDDTARAFIMIGASRRVTLDGRVDDISRIHATGAEYRRHGSAACGLLMVADGRVDAYFERHLNAWDALGSLCIAQEAGAVATVPPMDVFLRDGGPILCTNQALADAFAVALGDLT